MKTILSKAQNTHTKLNKRIAEVLEQEKGAASAEYAVVLMAAVGLGGLLVAILRSGEVQGMLLDLVQKAFSAAG